MYIYICMYIYIYIYIYYTYQNPASITSARMVHVVFPLGSVSRVQAVHCDARYILRYPNISRHIQKYPKSKNPNISKSYSDLRIFAGHSDMHNHCVPQVVDYHIKQEISGLPRHICTLAIKLYWLHYFFHESLFGRILMFLVAILDGLFHTQKVLDPSVT